MIADLKTMNYDRVVEIIRDSLCLDDSVTINSQTRLEELGAEDLDYIDIFHRLGVQVGDYIKDYETRQLTGRHSIDLRFVSMWETNRRNYARGEHLVNLSRIKDMKELTSKLTVADCVSIGEYTSEKRQKAA